MLARVVECQSKAGRSKEVGTKLENDVLQILQKQPGLQEGAIYRDPSNNVIRVLSICGDYCVYVYVSQTNLRSSMHGSVSGLTRKDTFGADFMFVAGSGKDWIGNQCKHALTEFSGTVHDSF